MANEVYNQKSDKSWTITMLLSLFLGEFGFHRFYTGYVGIGILQLLTFGGCGLWSLIDFFAILLNKYKDVDGNELADFNFIVAAILWLINVVVVVFILVYMLAGAMAR